MTDDILLRADAQRNRERILAAAEEVFLEQGAEASLENIAKRAGVGIGTLYRRFPTREALLAAAYSTRFLSLAKASRSRGDTLDPVAAVRTYLEELVLHTNVYRGLSTSLGTVLQSNTPGCHATTEEGRRLLKRAQDAKLVRSDVTFEDLVYVATTTALAVEQDSSPKARTAHLISLFLDGLVMR